MHLGSMILYYCMQLTDGHTDIVNQENPFIPDFSYHSKSYLHHAYRYTLKTRQLRAKVLKNGPCKQAVRSYWMYVSLSQVIPYERTTKLRILLNVLCDK